MYGSVWIGGCTPGALYQDQMWTTLQEEWANIDEDYIANIYESMPDHVAALLKAKGSWTKY